MSTTPLTLEAARRKIGEIFVYHMPFNRELGLELRRFDDDYVELSFTNQRKLVGNAAQEILHGGVIAAVMGGALASGVTSVAIMTAGMQFAAQGDQAGTDMTMVQSSRDIGEMVSNMLMVGMTASLGYRFSFALAAALAVLLLGINLASNRHPAAVRRQEE